MVLRQAVSVVWVGDQDVALDFYVNTLGFELRMDHKMENGFRWLAIGAPGQRDLDIALMAISTGPTLNDEQKAGLSQLMKTGALGCGVLHIDDCRKRYEELSAKGVKFMGEPEEQFYGIEAMLFDPFGNCWSFLQPSS